MRDVSDGMEYLTAENRFHDVILCNVGNTSIIHTNIYFVFLNLLPIQTSMCLLSGAIFHGVAGLMAE